MRIPKHEEIYAEYLRHVTEMCDMLPPPVLTYSGNGWWRGYYNVQTFKGWKRRWGHLRTSALRKQINMLKFARRVDQAIEDAGRECCDNQIGVPEYDPSL